MEETWRNVVGYEGMYVVSSFGRVKSLPKEYKTPQKGVFLSKERFLSPFQRPNGYLVVNLYKNGKRKPSYVHVGLKRDLTIIMCCRRERNVAGGYLWRFDGDIDLSHGHIMRQRKVVQFDLEGNLIAKFDTIKEAALLTNTNNGHISSCCGGKIKTANGFRWMYEEDYNNLKR